MRTRRAGFWALATVLVGPGAVAAQWTAVGHGTSAAPRADQAPLEVRFLDYGAQEVDGDQLYRQARESLNRGRYEEAAALFASLRESFPRSALVADSYYYQAFALYRSGQEQSQNRAAARRSYERARALIETQAAEHAQAATRSEAETLALRLSSAMARQGDTAARRQVDREAQEACSSDEQDMRALALSALLNMDSERAIPILREVIQERSVCNGELRAQAVFMLAQHDGDDVVDLLLDLAHRNPDPDPSVREAAVHWLGQSDRPEAVDALLSMLRDSNDRKIREGALFALSQTGDPRAGQALRDVALDPAAPGHLRSTAVFWIGQRDEEALPLLIELFGSIEDDEVREQIVFSVGQNDSGEARAWLRDRALDATEDSGVRGQAVFWLAQTGATVADLRAIYDGTDDREIKEQVLFGYSQMDGPESVDALMEVARSDPDRELRGNAVFWLGQSDDPRVPEFLMEIIRR